ncbi:hypothetical protein [Gemmatimonas sp.]|uniref:hypothetical protein n=1 Tax=Gemmatimonas sp. TaxID=1962908 RepID=UPI003561F6CB
MSLPILLKNWLSTLPTKASPASTDRILWYDQAGNASKAQTKAQLDAQLGYRLACLLTTTAVQSVSATTATAVLFNTETFDVGGLHSTSVNTSRITIPAGGDGLWLFAHTVTFTAAYIEQGSDRQSYIRRNGASAERHAAVRITMPPYTSALPSLTGATIVRAVATDYFEVVVFSERDINLPAAPGGVPNWQTSFSATRLGD